jgi:PepSY-associated TM region
MLLAARVSGRLPGASAAPHADPGAQNCILWFYERDHVSLRLEQLCRDMGSRRGHIDPLLPRDAVWQTWLDHPQKSAVRNALFQVHLWVGALVAAYVFVMSVSGSVIVYRSELSTMGLSVRRLVDLHENWLTGAAGRVTNGIGALCLTLLCLTGAVIWWPGIAHWRRSLTVDWRQGFARINWDLHSAAGFWCLLFVLMWALSGASLVQERLAAFSFLDPAVR